MTPGPYCPDHADLEAFARGRVPEPTAAVVRSHLGDCLHCSAAIRRLQRDLATGPADVESTLSHHDPEGRLDVTHDHLNAGGDGDAAGATAFVSYTRMGPDLTASLAPTAGRQGHQGGGREETDAGEKAAFPAGESLASVASSLQRRLLPEIAGYEVVKELGRGGMGVVYEAIDRAREARVALKTMRKKDASAIFRFKHEFRALADLSHPNLIPLFELSMTGDIWFLTMPLIDGVDFLCHVRPEPSARGEPTDFVLQDPPDRSGPDDTRHHGVSGLGIVQPIPTHRAFDTVRPASRSGRAARDRGPGGSRL